ncbi:MAG: glycosyltransferase [Endomicrobium sp.]|jgi:glycosyltransferase involved in cell wall biosynthesis|nr:glycosyltransferase [Endomicrobium sp.]
MKLLRKTNNEDKKVYWLAFIELFKIKYISKMSIKYKRYYIFGVQVYKKRCVSDFIDEEHFLTFLKTLSKSYKTILFFDHSLGGGTEKYFFDQLINLKKEYLVLRFQYFYVLKVYRLTIYYNDEYKYCQNSEISKLLSIIKKINLKEVVINNLVGYKSTLGILEIVSELKKSVWKNVRLSVRGHDFQAVCPSFNLLNDKFNYCRCPPISECLKCFPKIKVSNNLYANKVLLSGSSDIVLWRKKWNDFFSNNVDEVIFFSNSTKDIFCQVYPTLKNKFVIIPHFVYKLCKVEIKKHRAINIGVLGEINLIQKGKFIIEGMISLIPSKNVKIIIIGTFSKNKYQNVIVTGRYEKEKLPDIIQNEEIDIVFIPSIWPETFSYVTSEAMMMGLPVACFNLGSQAERVSIYDKGLIINEISADIALREIINFIDTRRDNLDK